MHIDEARLHASVDALRGELIAAIQDLVRIPTENLPPGGNERGGRNILPGACATWGSTWRSTPSLMFQD